MTFTEAAAFVMPFGQHKGRTLDDIASDDEGLSYLGWLRGVREEEEQDWPVDLALATYLDDPAIAKELEALT